MALFAHGFANKKKDSPAKMPTLLNKTIRLFLDSIGRRDEYEFYLNKFTHVDQATFALICPDPDNFEESAQALTFDLDALARLELHPAILLTGDRVHEMKMHLLNGEHAFDVLALDEISSTHIARADRFLRECNSKRTTGVLTVQGLGLADCLPALVPAITRRIHALRPAGPLRDCEGSILNYIYVNEIPTPALRPEDSGIAALGIQLLNLRPGTHFSVCSPWQLLEELFTVKGSGTVVRRKSCINRVTDLHDIDQGRLIALLEQAFKSEPLAERFMPQVHCAYIEEDYRGAALVEAHPAGAYLSKFAVGTQARGEGLANELWRNLVSHHPALFWRSRVGNPVNHWYERHATGSHQEDHWRIFWAGIPAQNLPSIIDCALQRESDFRPKPAA